MPASPSPTVGVARLGALFALAAACAFAAEPAGGRLDDLAEQNRRLQEQVRAQQKTIDELSARMADLVKASERQDRELRGLADRADAAAAPAPTGNREQEVRIGGETGLAFFNTGSDGQFPKAEFRVDDPVITLEAPVSRHVYFYTELKLLTREANTESFQLGELYADFEDVSAAWGRPGLLSFRAGRINIPFGEEYQVRTPVANPLISHSLSDLWGTDEGAEIYGRIGPAQYVLAIQNGGNSRLHDFNADKAVVGRVGWDPARWLHLSASAMRTGELSPTGDGLSELWFANGFFRALGSASSTTAFWADLYEGDAIARWKTGRVSAALGGAHYDDNDRRNDNSRRFRYGYLELVQNLGEKLYGAARLSQIRVPRGYPLVGWATAGEYFFRPSLTEELRRFSLGLGYRFDRPLILKAEYTWESGHLLNGTPRNDENFFGSEIAVKF